MGTSCPDIQHSIYLLVKPSVFTEEILHAYKSLDVYNYNLYWIELFSLGTLLQFAQLTAQQLLISSHHLSLCYIVCFLPPVFAHILNGYY